MSDKEVGVRQPFAQVTKINSTQLRMETRDILERARFGGERFLISTHGKPMAVVIGLAEFEGLTAPDAREPDAFSASDA